LPVSLCWSPRGLSRFSRLQIAYNNAFLAPIVDVPYATEHAYVFSNALPNTTYHWRVRCMADDGSVGDWATGAFQTVPPAITVRTPNGGELWRRGLEYFIAWDDNIDEAVSIGLYKSGAFVEFITTNAPSSGGFEWEPGFHLSPDSDYSVRIASVADGALMDDSNNDFYLDVPQITSISRQPGGAVVLEWEGTSAGVYVEYATAPLGQPWTELAGPLFTTRWTHVSPPNPDGGHYRLRLQ
jgi:hypothetical protein